MPVNTEHADYCAKKPDWTIVRDCIEGSKRIKDAGHCYLPKLHDQENAEYDIYRNRATFFNAVRRTHEAMVGLLWRKPPTMKLAADLAAIEKDADAKGNPFLAYARDITAEVCSVGRCGTLVDWNEEEKRPYLARYFAQDIVNWHSERVDGKVRLVMVVLAETAVMPNPDDAFVPKEVLQYRVLRIKDGAVVVELWQPAEGTTAKKHGESKPGSPQPREFKMVSTTPLLRRGQPLEEIPFVFHNADHPGPGISRVPLADLATVNIGHYRNSADYENGLHVCGTPTPYAIGFGSDAKFYLGSSHVWVTDSPTAKAGFLEFTGSGMTALENAIKLKESQMAALGARLIEPKQKDAESYDTVALRATGEASTLARIGQLCTESLVQALAWCAWWVGAAKDATEAATGIEFALNKDFVSASMTSEMLSAVVAAWQQNAISRETLHYQLSRGEFLEDGRTMEEELQSIKENPPMPQPLPTPPMDPNKNPPTNKPPGSGAE